MIALVREGREDSALLEPLRLELESEGKALDERRRALLTIVALPELERVAELAGSLAGRTIDDVIHCAGCLDYFDTKELERVNVAFTAHMLELARRAGARRFVYVSSAYACGYVDGMAPEALHAAPPGDPTEYTRTKRDAEWLVARSGLPYLVIRPSILVGDSRSGRYSGKRYGLYQQWMGLERLLCDRYHEDYHVVAPEEPLNFVHQDAFVAAFRAACDELPDGAVTHIVSRREGSPTLRQMWELWLRQVARPRRVFYYRSLEHVPLKEISPRQRAFLMFASVNVQISAHRWEFESTHLQRLRDGGLDFVDATLESLALCQERFVRSSPRVQRYLEEHAARFADLPSVVDGSAIELAAS